MGILGESAVVFYLELAEGGDVQWQAINVRVVG
jgi:hypothetical protein